MNAKVLVFVIYVEAIIQGRSYKQRTRGVRFKSGPILYRKYERGIKEPSISSPR